MAITTVNWSGMTSLSDLPSQANVVTGGSFWAGMLYMIWTVLFLALLGWGWELAIMASAFVGLILGTILVYAGLLNWTLLMPFFAIELVMFLYITYSGYKVKY